MKEYRVYIVMPDGEEYMIFSCFDDRAKAEEVARLAGSINRPYITCDGELI